MSGLYGVVAFPGEAAPGRPYTDGPEDQEAFLIHTSHDLDDCRRYRREVLVSLKGDDDIIFHWDDRTWNLFIVGDEMTNYPFKQEWLDQYEQWLDCWTRSLGRVNAPE